MYYWLVNKTNPVFPSTWLYVAPIIALIAGYLFLDEPIKPVTIIDAILVLMGVFFINKETLLELYKGGKLLKKA